MGRTTNNCDLKLTPPKLALLFTSLLLENRIRLKFFLTLVKRSSLTRHMREVRVLDYGNVQTVCSLHRIELLNCCKHQRPESMITEKSPKKSAG